MARRLAEIESIEPSGDCGYYKATLAVRESYNENFHGMAIEVLGSDLTTCAERALKIINAFNKPGA